jgi:transposase
VFDGASSHISKEMNIPNNIAIIKLPPYSTELNPAEQIWRLLKSRYFANHYFDSLDMAVKKAEYGMKQLAKDKKSLIKLTNWPWIRNAL